MDDNKRTWLRDPPTDRGPIVGVPKDDLDTLHARIKELEAERDIYRNAASDLAERVMEKEARAERAEAMLKEAVEALQTIVDSYDARSELYTNDADCAGNLADHARATLARIEAAQEEKG